MAEQDYFYEKYYDPSFLNVNKKLTTKEVHAIMSYAKLDTEECYFDIARTVCFTGHRPGDFPAHGHRESVTFKRLMSVLCLKIQESIDEGYTTFISGMAQGFDMWAARKVTVFKLKYPYIKLVLVLPFETQCVGYTPLEVYEYSSLIAAADKVICLQEKYSKDCMKRRNQYMVDHSSKIIGMMKRSNTGTGMTVNMAKRQGLKLDIFDMKSNPEIYGETEDDFRLLREGNQLKVKSVDEIDEFLRTHNIPETITFYTEPESRNLKP